MNDDEFHVIGVTTDFFWWLLHARLDSYGVYTGKENLSVSSDSYWEACLTPYRRQVSSEPSEP